MSAFDHHRDGAARRWRPGSYCVHSGRADACSGGEGGRTPAIDPLLAEQFLGEHLDG